MRPQWPWGRGRVSNRGSKRHNTVVTPQHRSKEANMPHAHSFLEMAKFPLFSYSHFFLIPTFSDRKKAKLRSHKQKHKI